MIERRGHRPLLAASSGRGHGAVSRGARQLPRADAAEVPQVQRLRDEVAARRRRRPGPAHARAGHQDGRSARRVLTRRPAARWSGSTSAAGMLAAARGALDPAQAPAAVARLPDPALAEGMGSSSSCCLAVHHLDGPVRPTSSAVAAVLAPAAGSSARRRDRTRRPADTVTPIDEDKDYDLPAGWTISCARWPMPALVEAAARSRPGRRHRLRVDRPPCRRARSPSRISPAKPTSGPVRRRRPRGAARHEAAALVLDREAGGGVSHQRLPGVDRRWPPHVVVAGRPPGRMRSSESDDSNRCGAAPARSAGWKLACARGRRSVGVQHQLACITACRCGSRGPRGRRDPSSAPPDPTGTSCHADDPILAWGRLGVEPINGGFCTLVAVRRPTSPSGRRPRTGSIAGRSRSRRRAEPAGDGGLALPVVLGDLPPRYTRRAMAFRDHRDWLDHLRRGRLREVAARSIPASRSPRSPPG